MKLKINIKRAEAVFLLAAFILSCYAVIYTYAIQQRFEDEEAVQFVREGRIYDVNGVLLLEDGVIKEPDAYSFLLGYRTEDGNSSGIRRSFGRYLSAAVEEKFEEETDSNGYIHRIPYNLGADICITIDNDFQTYCMNILRTNSFFSGADSSIIILDNKDHSVCAMASVKSDDLNANRYSADSKYRKEVNKAIEDHSGFWLDENLLRSNIGSAFKAVSAIPIIESKLDKLKVADATERVVNNSLTITNWAGLPYEGSHDVDLEKALMYSVNVYFAAMYLDNPGLARQLAEKAVELCFNELIDTDFTPEIMKANPETYMSQMLLKDRLTDMNEIAHVSYGQGGVSASPLHMAMLYQAIINDGEIVRPHMLVSAVNSEGRSVLDKKHEPGSEVIGKLAEKKTVRTLRKLLEKTAEDYFADLSVPEGTIAKTSTAETENSGRICWICCANEKYTIVIRSRNDAGSSKLKAIAADILNYTYI